MRSAGSVQFFFFSEESLRLRLPRLLLEESESAATVKLTS